ncbi:MAG: hypothetical protein GY719_10745 [bacterium]|nr:hypothetical protein [bacterium]
MTLLSSAGPVRTPDALLGIEEQVLSDMNAAELLWCGRAATALYWAYRLAGSEGHREEELEVILPAMVCATPAMAALVAGLTPRFADCDPATGMVTLESVQAVWTARTRAVLFVHLYGQTADLDQLAHWCHEHDAILIEDNAQALGANTPNGLPAGATGAMTVYSFNPTKILECGGGALQIRDGDLALKLRELLAIERRPSIPDADRRALLSLSYRNLHHSLVALRRLSPDLDICTSFMRVRPAYESLLIRPLDDVSALAAGWHELATILERRFEKAEICCELLEDEGPWSLLAGWRTSGVCWRFSLLFDAPDRLVAFSEAVRRDGFHVSNLYWELSSFFRPEDACPRADRFARRIVNLWVDDSVSVDSVRRCCESLKIHGESAASTVASHPGS